MKKSNICFLLLSAILIATITLPASSQDKKLTLSKGIPVTEQLKTGDKIIYTVNLEPAMFAFFDLEQMGIDASVTTYDPDGKKIRSFDSPNGRNGMEPVSVFSDKKGKYTIEVISIDAPGRQGKFKMTWTKLEPKGQTPDKLIDQYFSPWNNNTTPGAAIAVEKEGKIIFKKGYGSAEPEYSIPITSQSVFHIASVSKQFTCFSILLLEKEGKLSINDDIRKYIPEVPDFGKTITLNHLMHHTSGLRDQWELLAIAGWRLDDNITKDQVLRIVSHQKELNFNPGDEYMYCNTGFTLLAEVVARVSGMPFTEFTKKRIFEPLKMTSTLFYDDCEKLVKNRAYSYYIDSTGYKKSNLSYSIAGATSLFTTVEDLCRWSANFENPVAGDRDIINRMNLRGVLNKGDTITYAMGQDIVSYKGLKMIVHGGADAGYRSILVRFPDQKLSVNVLSNLASFDPGDLAFRVADIYLKDKFVKVPDKKEQDNNKSAEPKKEESSPVVKIAHEVLDSYCGQYEVQPGVIATISLDGESLFVTAPELPKSPLYVISENDFEVKAANARLSFIKGDKGTIDRMKVIMGGNEIMAMRLPDFDPSKVNLQDFVGDYYSPELFTTYAVTVEGGKLVAKHFRTGNINLTISKPDSFTGDRWYFGLVKFERNQSGIVNSFILSGGRVRHVKFEKVEVKAL